MELGKRLREIASFVPCGSIVADIGTDHALLPINLVEKGLSPRAIASDVHRGPYEAAKEAICARGLREKIDLRLGDGLKILSPGEAHVAVIAGMGGNTIREVLNASPEVVGSLKRLILQPMADIYDLRRWLVHNGWLLADEKLVSEGERLYVIIAADPGVEKVTDPLSLEIGPRLLEKQDPYLPLFLEKKVQDLERILSGLSNSQKSQNQKKARDVKKKLFEFRRVLRQCR